MNLKLNAIFFTIINLLWNRGKRRVKICVLEKKWLLHVCRQKVSTAFAYRNMVFVYIRLLWYVQECSFENSCSGTRYLTVYAQNLNQNIELIIISNGILDITQELDSNENCYQIGKHLHTYDVRNQNLIRPLWHHHLLKMSDCKAKWLFHLVAVDLWIIGFHIST